MGANEVLKRLALSVKAQKMGAEREEDKVLVVQLVLAINVKDKVLRPLNQLPNPSNLNLASKASSMNRVSRYVHRHKE